MSSILETFPMSEQRCQFTAPDGIYEICWDPETSQVFVHNGEKIVFTSSDTTIQSIVSKLFPTCTITNVKCPNNLQLSLWNDVYSKYTSGQITNDERLSVFQSMKKQTVKKSMVSTCEFFGFDLIELE